MGCQIFAANEAAVCSHEIFDRARDFAAVEGVASAVGNCFECGGKGWVTERFAVPRGVAAGEIDVGETRKLAIDGSAPIPPASDHFRNGKALASVSDCGFEDFLEWQLTEASVEFGPTIDTARHRNGERPLRGDEFQIAALEFFRRQAERTAAAGVEAVKFLRVGVPNDGEEIAARTAAHRLSNGEHRVRSDRGIDRIAARLQDFEGGHRGEWLAGGGHAVAADGGRARNEGLLAGTFGCPRVHDRTETDEGRDN